MVHSSSQGFLVSKIAISLVLFLLSTATAIAQPKHPAKVTFLRASAGEFGYDQEVRVTADSVIVDIQVGEGYPTHYARAVTSDEYQ